MGNKLLFALSLFLLASCAPALDAARQQVRTNVAERLPKQAAPSEPRSKDELTRWLEETLNHNLSLDDAVAIALLNNRRLRARNAELGISRADLIDAGLPQNPVFVVERRLKGQALELDVAQDFLSIFLIPLKRRLAVAEFEAIKLKVSHDILGHAFEVRSAFFDLQGAQQMQEMRQTVVDAADASYDASRKLFQAGNITQLELLQEQNAAAEARLELASADSELVQRRERLNVLMGLWGENTNWTVAVRLPDVPESDLNLAGLETKAISERFDLLQARTELEALASAAGLTDITSVLPEISLAAHFEREPEGDSSFGPSIEIPIPLFNFGWGARARAEAMFEQSAENYAGLAIEIRSEIRTAYSKMQAARRKVQYYRTQVLPLQSSALRETQLQYNGMFVGVFQLLQAKRAQIAAGSAYIEQLHEYWSSRVELEKALGRALPIPRESPVTSPEGSSETNHQHHH